VSKRPRPSIRIIDGSGVTVTLSSRSSTWAMSAPTWLFIRVNPHMFEAVLSDLNGLSAVVNAVTS
jgi:hypothetical protein